MLSFFNLPLYLHRFNLNHYFADFRLKSADTTLVSCDVTWYPVDENDDTNSETNAKAADTESDREEIENDNWKTSPMMDVGLSLKHETASEFLIRFSMAGPSVYITIRAHRSQSRRQSSGSNAIQIFMVDTINSLPSPAPRCVNGPTTSPCLKLEISAASSSSLVGNSKTGERLQSVEPW